MTGAAVVRRLNPIRALERRLDTRIAAEIRRSLQALDLQPQHLELQLHDALLQRRASFRVRKALLEKRILRLEAEKALLQRRETVHVEPPCGCGDETVGGPDLGDLSASGSVVTGVQVAILAVLALNLALNVVVLASLTHLLHVNRRADRVSAYRPVGRLAAQGTPGQPIHVDTLRFRHGNTAYEFTPHPDADDFTLLDVRDAGRSPTVAIGFPPHRAALLSVGALGPGLWLHPPSSPASRNPDGSPTSATAPARSRRPGSGTE